ncbi:MAG TPA: hypothetical protein VGM76_12265, partial [Lacipirellulaceae bacterium]
MPSDNLDRDKMYAGNAADSDGDYELAPIESEPAPASPQRALASSDDEDGSELELEPIDVEILAAAKRRAEDAVVAATRAIDIDKIYKDIEPSRELKLPAELLKDFRFQFQVKHLLYATAGVAILLTLLKALHVQGVGDALVIVLMMSIFAATAYFQWQDRRRLAEADRRRQEMYAARREQFGHRSGQAAGGTSDVAGTAARKLTPEDFQRVSVTPPTAGRTPLRMRLSVGQWLAAGACAAILIWIVYAVGGPQNGAMLFGMMALAGLVVHAFGYDPPEVVAFAWWLMLVLYIVLGIFTAVWH